MTDPLRIPLRFRRGDAKVLKARADWFEANGHTQEDITLYRQAAFAAWSGEPLIVACNHSREVELMADLFARVGIKRPAIG